MGKSRRVAALCAALALTWAFAGCSKSQEPPNTIQWINTTYAVLIEEGGGNLSEVGGMAKTSENEKKVKASLKQAWGINGRTNAEDKIEWLLTEGDSAQYARDMKFLEEKGALELTDEQLEEALMQQGYDETGRACIASMLDAYRERGEHAIDAWDLCRATQLLGYFYLAGYYTKEEALDKSLEVAQRIQRSYSSWDEMMESYFTGFQYYQEDDKNNPESETAKRRAAYEAIKEKKNSPYQISWNMQLDKTW